MMDENLKSLLLDARTESIVRQYIPTRATLDNLANFFAGFADGTRIKIVSALSITPMCVSDISSILSLNQTTVSHQLKNLKMIGIVDVYRQGKVAFYSIKNKTVLDILLSAVGMI